MRAEAALTGTATMEIGRHHWAQWAILNREGARGRLGYPKVVNFYQPARRKDSDESSTRLHMTAEDMKLVELIGVAVQYATALERLALTEYYGAYPGAPVEMERRMAQLRRKINRSQSHAYSVVHGAEKFVAGVIAGWLSQPR